VVCKAVTRLALKQPPIAIALKQLLPSLETKALTMESAQWQVQRIPNFP